MKRSLGPFLVAFALLIGVSEAKTRLSAKELKVVGRVLDVQTVDMNGDGLDDMVVAHLAKDEARDSEGRLKRMISVFVQRTKFVQRWTREATYSVEVPNDAVLFAAGDFHPKPGGEVALLSYKGITLLHQDEKKLPLKAKSFIKTPEGGFFDFPADGGLFLWSLAPALESKSKPSLLFPTKTGYLVYGPDAKAGLAERGRVNVRSTERFGPPLETEFLNRFLTYFSRLPRVVAIDMNGDGRLDLVTYRSKGLATFIQGADKRFQPEPTKTLSLKVVEQAAKKSKEKGDGKDAFENVKLALRDLNGDKRVDIVATKTLGKVGVFESLRTQVLVFLAGPKGIQDVRPNRIINLKGITTFPEFTDFNGDNDIDIVLSSLRMDLITNVKRAITSSVSTTYTVYLYRGGDRVYSKDADFERSVDVDLELIEKQGKVRLTFFGGDLTGDGLKDMVTVASRKKIELVPAGIESSFFSGKYLTLKDGDGSELEVPTSPTMLIRDIDKDKKDELIFIYKKPDDPEKTTIRIVEEGAR